MGKYLPLLLIDTMQVCSLPMSNPHFGGICQSIGLPPDTTFGVKSPAPKNLDILCLFTAKNRVSDCIGDLLSSDTGARMDGAFQTLCIPTSRVHYLGARMFSMYGQLWLQFAVSAYS